MNEKKQEKKQGARKVYMLGTCLLNRSVTIKPPVEKVMTGGQVQQVEPEKIVNFDYGFYETSDLEEQEALEGKAKFNGQNPAYGYTLLSDVDLAILDQIKAKGHEKKEWHGRLLAVKRAIADSTGA